MQNEPVQFICVECGAKTSGMVGFRYAERVEVKRQWIMTVETETSTRFADCAECGSKNDVWPGYSTDYKWKPRNGKTQ